MQYQWSTVYLCGLRRSWEGVLMEVAELWLLTSSVTSDFPLRHVGLQQVNICSSDWRRKKDNNMFVTLVAKNKTKLNVRSFVCLLFWGVGFEAGVGAVGERHVAWSANSMRTATPMTAGVATTTHVSALTSGFRVTSWKMDDCSSGPDTDRKYPLRLILGVVPSGSICLTVKRKIVNTFVSMTPTLSTVVVMCIPLAR